MGYFDDWFGTEDYFEGWFDVVEEGAEPPPSGHGGVSKSRILGTLAPKPAIPPWRQVQDHATSNALTDIRRFLADALERSENYGVHVEVTFAAADTPTRVDTGLGGAPKGYKVVRASAAMHVFDATPTTPLDPVRDRGVTWLQASAPGTVTLYFY